MKPANVFFQEGPSYSSRTLSHFQGRLELLELFLWSHWKSTSPGLLPWPLGWPAWQFQSCRRRNNVKTNARTVVNFNPIQEKDLQGWLVVLDHMCWIIGSRSLGLNPLIYLGFQKRHNGWCQSIMTLSSHLGGFKPPTIGVKCDSPWDDWNGCEGSELELVSNKCSIT